MEEKNDEKQIGEVSSYFKNVNVAAVKLFGNLKKGNKIHLKGHTTNFEQEVGSMQIDGKNLEEGKSGDHVGIKVENRVRPGDLVFLVK
jgi:translation elongation factor EF-1alpha